MSVIVKGMEMPKYCSDCPLLDGDTGRCNILGITVCDYIPKACPLVEVVRCKECKHRDAETGFCEGRGIPMQLVPCYGFCDKGERREDVEETD